MGKIRFVGLDVHKETIAIGVADEGQGEPADVATVPNATQQLIKRLRRRGGDHVLRCCYEAGPTGYGLHRDLNAAIASRPIGEMQRSSRGFFVRAI